MRCIVKFNTYKFTNPVHFNLDINPCKKNTVTGPFFIKVRRPVLKLEVLNLPALCAKFLISCYIKLRVSF